MDLEELKDLRSRISGYIGLVNNYDMDNDVKMKIIVQLSRAKLNITNAIDFLELLNILSKRD